MIISTSNKNRFNSKINHQQYANFRNVTYKFYDNIQTEKHYHFLKIYAVLDALQLNDYVLYLDDDAFFTRTDWDYKSIFDLYDKDLIVAESPRRNEGKTPLFNSGVMFFKKSNDVISLLKDTLSLEKYQWDTKWGASVQGDQDHLIYLTQTKYNGIEKIINQRDINARPYDYDGSYLYPIVHFAGKNKNIEEFCSNICDLFNIQK